MAVEQLLIWSTEIVREGEGVVRLVAKKPLCRMSIAQAARMLGCTPWTVSRLYQDGILSGWKPGASGQRKDGRASNAKVVLDAESVLKHKLAVSQVGIS